MCWLLVLRWGLRRRLAVATGRRWHVIRRRRRGVLRSCGWRGVSLQALCRLLSSTWAGTREQRTGDTVSETALCEVIGEPIKRLA